MKTDRRLIALLSDRVRKISKHWAVVDEVLPAQFPLVVLSVYERAGFLAKWASRSEVDAGLAAEVQGVKLAVGRFKLAKRKLFGRMRVFRGLMRAFWASSEFYPATPLLPGAGAGDDVFFDAAERMAIVWRWLGEVSPLPPGRMVALHDGYSGADFAVDLAALRGLADEVREARLEMRIARGRVEVFHAEMVKLVMAYGHSVRGRVGTGSPLLDWLPRTWPERREPGRA